MSAEATGRTGEMSLPDVIQQLGGKLKIGPVEVTSEIAWVSENLPNGIFDVEFRDPNLNSGELLRIRTEDGPLAIKTFLDPDHSYLDFRQPWKRLWSVAAEYQKAARAQQEWRPEQRIHLGIVGICDLGNGQVEVSSPSLIDGKVCEPGILMRWLPQEDNLYQILLRDPETFRGLLPEAVKAIGANQTPLSQDEAYEFGGVDSVISWIDGGNLNNLRASRDPAIRELGVRFWEGFLGFNRRYREAVEQRARQPGVVVDGNGDSKILNGFRVDSRVGYIDPIALLLKTGGGEEDFVLARWSFHDRIAELGYATVYLRALEKLAGKAGFANLDRETVSDLRRLEIEHYSEIFGEVASEGRLAAIHLMYEAGYASVEFELNLRRAAELESGREAGSEPSQAELEARNLAWGLKDVMLEAIEEAHAVAQDSGLEKGLS